MGEIKCGEIGVWLDASAVRILGNGWIECAVFMRELMEIAKRYQGTDVKGTVMAGAASPWARSSQRMTTVFSPCTRKTVL